MTLAVTAVYVFAVLALLYWIPLRPWLRRWGVTDAELSEPRLSDRDVPDPNYAAMAAVTIDARPECIWPWLLQLGKGRGGLYSYDWLDRLFGYLDAPSATRILPEFQQLRVGDVIPVGGSAGGFPVTAVSPYHALVMSGQAGGSQWAWELDLSPLDKHRTRLISRSRGRFSPSIGMKLFMMVLEPAAFIMTRKMLLGIKQRSEALSQSMVLSPQSPVESPQSTVHNRQLT